MTNGTNNSDDEQNLIKQVFKGLMHEEKHDKFKYEHNISRYLHDFLIIAILTLVVIFIARHYDLMEMITEFTHHHEDWELDEFLAVMLFWALSFAVFSYRRAKELRKSQKVLIDANIDLIDAMAEIKKLKGIIPICASCKKVRDDGGYWQQVEMYIKDHSDAEFSHGICPDCARELYPDIKLDESAT